MRQFLSRLRARVIVIAALSLAAFSQPAWAWGPHSEITQAGLNALGPKDALAESLGEKLHKLPQYCWMADQRQTLIVHADETFYADDYLLFPGVARHSDHICPEVKRTYSPHFRRALQALRTETPANAARWIGSLLHFVEDTGSPPHAAEIRGDVHSKMENWVDAKKIIIAGYEPQMFGGDDASAEAGFLRRMDGLIEFSKARAMRCRADVEAGNRPAVEPVVLESALETSRVVADLLHTLGVLARQNPPGGEIDGQAPACAGLGKLDHVPAKIVLLGTTYSTLADEKGHFVLSHLPPGTYRLACFGAGGLLETRDVELKRAGGSPAIVDLPAKIHPGGLVRNPDFKVSWVSAGAPDEWYAIPHSGKNPAGWQGEWLPLEQGKEYRLIIHWKQSLPASVEGDVLVRLKKTLNANLPPAIGAPITRATSEQRISASVEKGGWAQIFIRTPGKPADLIESIDLLPDGPR